MSTMAGASLLGAATPSAKNQYFELQYFQLRNGMHPERANDFFGNHYAPAIQKLGLPPCGFFNAVIAQQSPFLLALLTHPNISSVETLHQRLQEDKEYQKGAEAYLTSDLAYVRREASLLRAFDGMPAIRPPADKPKSGAHIFEIRTYESNTSLTLRRKIKMFNEGEMQIFERLGMKPVFFGETLMGRNMPNLTYMLAFDDLASREKLWKDFGADPEWAKLRSTAGYSDAEIVSNISNMIVRPTSFSQVK